MKNYYDSKVKGLLSATLLCLSSTVFCNQGQPTADPLIEAKVEHLLQKMTLLEKIGQMNQVSYFMSEESALDSIRQGQAGSLLNPIGFESDPDIKQVNKLQRIAIDGSRLGIPLLIGRDVIHGFKTIFPIPLGQAASFDPLLVQKGARIAAQEARAGGVHLTFAPMLDLAHDARWGRIAESFGEDPYLISQLGKAMIKGFQTDDLSAPTAIAATAKHFIGYGAAEGGRDYNSTTIPPYLLRNNYLPPFKAAVEQQVAAVMTAFNDNDGVPATGNRYLLRNILRDEWQFDGVVMSDWTASGEMIEHGFAINRQDVARITANAGVDLEMVSGTYVSELPVLIKQGKVSEATIDNAVRNILRLKFRLGLFEQPYFDEQAKQTTFLTKANLAAAKQMAIESAVLLKNEQNTLPLTQAKTIALIGPLADQPHEQLGTWSWDGDRSATVTPLTAFRQQPDLTILFESGLGYSRDNQTTHFEQVKQTVEKADVAVVFLGEESILSGEAHALANLDLVGAQSELLSLVKSVGKPVILVIIAGRPLTIEKNLVDADAVIYSFHPGTMGGPALVDLILGQANFSGRLPVTFVRQVGQIPLYYNHNNTGRPAPDTVINLYDIPVKAQQTSLGNTSYYLDAGRDPLYPFGFGLSYSQFEYQNIQLSTVNMKPDSMLTVSADITNTSQREGTDVVQLYINGRGLSLVRPVRELKGFQRITIKAGETVHVEFKLTPTDLAFYGVTQTLTAEPGHYSVWIAPNSQEGLKADFVYGP